MNDAGPPAGRALRPLARRRSLRWRSTWRRPRTEHLRRWARRPRVLSPDLLRLLPLLRREYRVQRPASAGDDRIQLRLNLSPHRSQLAALAVHDRVDQGLLLGRETYLAGKSGPELTARLSRSMLVTEAGSPEHVWQEEQSVHRDARQSAGKGNEQQYKHGGKWSGGRPPRAGTLSRIRWCGGGHEKTLTEIIGSTPVRVTSRCSPAL
jgi:hypothetical protein